MCCTSVSTELSSVLSNTRAAIVYLSQEQHSIFKLQIKTDVYFQAVWGSSLCRRPRATQDPNDVMSVVEQWTHWAAGKAVRMSSVYKLSHGDSFCWDVTCLCAGHVSMRRGSVWGPAELQEMFGPNPGWGAAGGGGDSPAGSDVQSHWGLCLLHKYNFYNTTTQDVPFFQRFSD